MLETLDFTIRIGGTPTFLYFDLYLNTAYAAHYVYLSIRHCFLWVEPTTHQSLWKIMRAQHLETCLTIGYLKETFRSWRQTKPQRPSFDYFLQSNSCVKFFIPDHLFFKGAISRIARLLSFHSFGAKNSLERQKTPLNQACKYRILVAFQLLLVSHLD